MKKRAITGAILALILIPTVSFEIFFGHISSFNDFICCYCIN
jgi:hypothetical protein